MTDYENRFSVKREAPQTPNGSPASEQSVDVSIVMPCLNEETAIEDCVVEARTALRALGMSGEVLVVDNGSSDNSVALAQSAGARVVREDARGYGNACRRGLSEARGQYVVMGDADGTYDFSALPAFVGPLMDGYDMVIGDRLNKEMEKGAMPWLHRYVGNPVLTATLNVFFGSSIQDAHCGLRSINKHCLEELSLSASGMEFASEFIIEALQHGVRVEQFPIRYRSRHGGQPKLRTFRDGLRHLRLILSHFWDSLTETKEPVRHPAHKWPRPVLVTGADPIVDLSSSEVIDLTASDRNSGRLAVRPDSEEVRAL